MDKTVAQDVLHNASLNVFHLRLLVLTTVMVAFAGYNLLVYSVALPILVHQWGLTTLQAGLLGSYALIGMMVGDFSFGYISRHLGSKKTSIICLAVLGVISVMQGAASGYEELGVLRVISGIAVGGLMPSVISTMSEYAPRRQKNTLSAIMVSGYSIGGIFASFIGLFLSGEYGWSVLFYAGGVQLLLIPFMLGIIPPEIDRLIHDGDMEAAKRLLGRVNRNYAPNSNDILVSKHQHQHHHSVLELFGFRNRLATAIFWVIFFGCLLVAYSIINWLPKIMLARGFMIQSSLLFFLSLNIGAIVGGVCGGILGDKFSTKSVLTYFFIVCAICLVLLGQVGSEPLLYVLVFILGATTIGSQTLVYILIAHHYTPPLRATAIGWSSGVGRLGAISGPIIGGVLIGSYFSVNAYLVSISVFAVLSALATSLVPKPELDS